MKIRQKQKKPKEKNKCMKQMRRVSHYPIPEPRDSPNTPLVDVVGRTSIPSVQGHACGFASGRKSQCASASVRVPALSFHTAHDPPREGSSVQRTRMCHYELWTNVFFSLIISHETEMLMLIFYYILDGKVLYCITHYTMVTNYMITLTYYCINQVPSLLIPRLQKERIKIKYPGVSYHLLQCLRRCVGAAAESWWR